jgi:hypothetical protein
MWLLDEKCIFFVDFADIFKDLDYTTDSLFILLLASFMIQKVNNERENRFYISWCTSSDEKSVKSPNALKISQNSKN